MNNGKEIASLAQSQENSKKIEQRPWGMFEILEDAADHKVKNLTVFPGRRLSYQRHQHRSENWVVVSGVAKVTLDGEEIILNVGEHIFISVGQKHRLENPGQNNLVIIEVQTGDYFGEDDIERFDDDFGRAPEKQ